MTCHYKFDPESHARFASASGDRNPIHTDAIASRRTQAGAPIVHGIHSLLWMLDCICRNGIDLSRATTLRAKFLQPIYVGEEFSLEVGSYTQSHVRARILCGMDEAVTVSVGANDSRPESQFDLQGGDNCIDIPEAPLQLEFEKMLGFEGALRFGPRVDEMEDMFPFAAASLGLGRLCALASHSTLVGMIIPGLHSMFIGLDLALDRPADRRADSIRFRVVSVLGRFRSVRIAVAGAGVWGTLETISRIPPSKQASMRRITQLVRADEFRNADALVIGGSRGLGELAAKIIAAGGANVTITYATGENDAILVAEEIRNAGGKCEIEHYDVHLPAAEQLSKLGAVPSHLYYFATPRIFRRKKGLLDKQRLTEFDLYYSSAFVELVQHLATSRPRGIRAFYPSTTFINERPEGLTEYAMSKAAAEVLCSDIPRYLRNVSIVSRRLPRLPTDQTSSVVQGLTLDPVDVILPIVREIQI